MPIRLEVTSQLADTRALAKKKQLHNLGYKNITDVWLTDVYTIDKPLSKQHIETISTLFINPVTHIASFDKPLAPKQFDWVIEIGFLPGVTDNVANTAREVIEDKLKTKFIGDEGVYSSQLVFLKGNLKKNAVETIGKNLANPLIQRVHIKQFTEFMKQKGMEKIIPKVNLEKKVQVDEVNLNVSDEELIKIGKQGIANKDGTRRGPLALDLGYMKAIQTYFKKQKRNPTDVELESIAQTWSEHCKHTIFSDPIDEIKEGLYKTYIQMATNKIRKKRKKNDFCVSVFTDNSGAIVFDKDYLVTHKVETHNSPSALDPFGGSITGIVGVNRDAIGFGRGAKPILNTYGFCFANPRKDKTLFKDANLTQQMLSPKRIMEGVINGVNVGGNCSGIPTPQGFVFFDERYKGKPLIFVGTAGLIPKIIHEKPGHYKKAQKGDYIVMVGGRVGLDGIHGATFSSEALNTGSPATAVQIGDPITQKKMSDAIVKEARQLGLYNSITDNGAGGLSCSVAEMAKETDGAYVQLEKVPLKYPGLNPWQTWISESQERMTLAVPKNTWGKFSNLMQRRGVEATIIGEFTNSGKCIVDYKQQRIMDIDMDFLHDGLPPRPMKTTFTKVTHREPKLTQPKTFTSTLLTLLQRLNITSYEFISMQYDHEVQATSVLKPLQGKGRVNADTTVIRPVLSSKKGIAFSQSLYPTYSDIDTYNMAASSIDTAIRNIVAIGGSIDHLALLDNFCWCSANESERLGQLKRAAKACYDYALAYNIPFISGKDSMFNDFNGYDNKGNPVKISIPPTLLISSVAVLKDITKVISLDAKFPGDLLYILGETNDELGGSEYYAQLGYIGNAIPQVHAKKNKKMYEIFYLAAQKELIASSISISRGGLAIALAKTAMGGKLGMTISLKKIPGQVTCDDFALFSESQGRILVTINPKHKINFEKIMKHVPHAQIGKVTRKEDFKIVGKNGKQIVNTTVTKLLKNYKSTFKGY